MKKINKNANSLKSIIYYFSGTGNTAHAVNLIWEQLHAAGHEVTVFPITEEPVLQSEKYDFQIIAFPIFSWSAPAIMKQFIRKKLRSGSTKTAILAINGAVFTKNGTLVKGYSGQALEQIEQMLKRKHIAVFLSANASFPDNWTQATNPCNTQDSETIIRLGETEVNSFIQKFLTEKHQLYRCGWFNRIWSSIVALLFGVIGRRMLGKFFIADNHCTGCSICAKTCPVKNICMVQKKPVWDAHCEDCNRCINICPEKAIQVSIPLMVVHLTINLGFTVWAIVALLTKIPEWIQIPEFLLICLETILIVVVTLILVWVNLVPIDGLFRILMRIQGLRRFCTISYTNKFRRYMAPGFNPMKK